MTTRVPGGGRVPVDEPVEPSLIAQQSERVLPGVAPTVDSQRVPPPARPHVPGQPFPSTTSFARGNAATVNDQLRQRVQSAVAFHIGGKLPGIGLTGAVNPISNRFIGMFGDNPQMVSALEADVNTLFALTDEEIAAKISRGEKLGQFGDVFDAIAEISWEVGADELAARLNAERTDAISGTFEALTSEEALHLTLGSPDALAGSHRDGAPISGDQRGQAFKGLFDVAGAWSFSPGERLLAVTVGEQTVGVRTGADFDPDNHLDVMAEVVRAQADGRIVGGGLMKPENPGGIQAVLDKAHEIGGFLDENPGLRNSIDTVWEFALGDAEQTRRLWQGDGSGPLERASDRYRDEKGQMTVESVRLASVIPFPEAEIIATVARSFMEDQEGLSSQDALALAATTVAEERDALRSEFSSLTQEELLEELEADAEGQSALGGAIESGMAWVLEKFEKWDLFSQWVGLNVIEDAAVFGPRDADMEEGFRRFSEAQDVEFGDTAGDYFGLSGGGADVANLAVGGIFDPTNFLFVGGKGLAALARRALTEPKYAGIYLKMGKFPHIAKQIAEGGKTVKAATAMERIAAVERLGLTGTDEVAALAGKEVLDDGGNVVLGAVEEIPEATRNARGVMAVVGSSMGLDDADYIDLLKVALDPDGTVDQVNAIWTRAMGKDWLPNTSMGPVRHSTVEGMGRMLDAAIGGHLSDEHLDTMFKMFGKLSVGRTFRLGENQAMTNFGELAIQFFPADSDRAANVIMRAAEARIAAGDDLAMAGAAATSKEQARRAILDAAGPTKQMLEAGDPRAVNQNLASVEDALTNLSRQGFDAETEAAIRTQLNVMHRNMSRRVDDAGPRLTARLEERALAGKHLKAATALEADQAANATRNVMAEQVYRMFDEVAQDLNEQFGRDVVPVIRGKVNPLAPDVPVRDWSQVTGVKSQLVQNDEDLALMMGLSVDNADLAREADAVGMFSRSQKMMLPASPYEVLLFQKLGGDENLLRKASAAFRSQKVKKWSGKLKLVFAMNLLVNPLTAGKITLDETLRFLADTGEVGTFLRATAAGLPLGVGRGSEAVVGQVKRWRGGGSSVANSYAKQYSRNVGGWAADDFADYGWVARPPRRVTDPAQMSLAQYREQAERWVNGSLLNDRRFREYARWIDKAEVLADGTKIPPPEFVDWWEHGGDSPRPGRADAKEIKVTLRDSPVVGSELTADQAFNIVDRVFDNWLELLVDESARPLMRTRLLKAATTAGDQFDLVKDARLLNAISQVPGISGQTGFGSQIFNVFFGAPSGRRAGVFYEHYFDEAFTTLKARHGDRVLTTEKLMEFAKVDRETAEWWLKQGSDNATVAKLIAETGARTEAQLAARAAAYAERRADDLMYRFTSASMVGRGVESALLFPFARAQADFLSWWSDHLTKPMTTRFSLEQRAQMPNMVRGLVEKVERIPINVRALGKYSHLVAAANNDEPSVVDQVIDNLTFFPVRFGTEMLLDVSPQFGPLPSWMFDLMVDKGVISEEVEENIMALFPALEFTELEDDPLEDLFNRWLPNSRRSLRDLTVGAMRAMYAIGGEDVHTNPGLSGTIANVIADNKVPASTGDFQAALGSDWLKDNVWNLVPGSDEWNAEIIGLSTRGATQANTDEGWQDLADRTSPLAGYDAEYRALRAFEALFDESRFSTMAKAGLFQANDLLEVDGVPRIKGIWDKYIAGQADQEELEYLDDALTTAYFDAGRVDILPGVSYMDYLHLTNPELSVNLIAKNEDSGIPARGGAQRVGEQRMSHAEFRNAHINKLTGRLQEIPPGPEGAEVVADARRLGWIVSRSMESTPKNPGWMQDAAEAVYKSGQRAVHGVWESVSHRTWQAGLKKAIEKKTFALPAKEAMVLKAAGVEGITAGQEFTYAEFHALIDDFDERFDVAQPMLINTLEKGAVHGQLARHNDAYGQGLLDALHQAELDAQKAGISSVEDWPEEFKVKIRDHFREAVNLGYLSVKDYAQEIAPIFGPLDYEPPVPPPVAELTSGLRISGAELDDMAVIDGDTVSVMLEDGPMRVRLIGINAPEVTQAGYQDARAMLEEVVAGADEVVIGIYKPELFGVTQLSAPGERRLLAWLYVDGVPLYNPAVFTASNPRGAGVGGEVQDLQALLEAARGAS